MTEFQEGEVYWLEFEEEFWPVVLLDETTAADAGISTDLGDGHEYRAVTFIGSGEGMAAPVEHLSDFSWDDADKLATENPDIQAAITATENFRPRPEEGAEGEEGEAAAEEAAEGAEEGAAEEGEAQADADAEAAKKAEEEAAAAAAEEEAKRKAEEEAAAAAAAEEEAKRQAEEAAAAAEVARLQAEMEESRKKAEEAEAARKKQEEEEAAAAAAKKEEEEKAKQAATKTPTPPASAAKSAADKAAAGEKKKSIPAAPGAKKAAPKKSFARKSTASSPSSSVNPAPKKSPTQSPPAEEKPQEDQAPEKAAEPKQDEVEQPPQEEQQQEQKQDGETAPSKPKVTAEETAKRKEFWNNLRDKLPTSRTAEAKADRKKLFSAFDPNGNGYLSLAEVDAGCRKELQLEQLTDDLAPILMRAFTAAKDARKAKGKNKKHGDDYVERIEFRLLFVYIKRYFELWFMFDEIDTSDDRRINFDEFKSCIGEMESWGVKIDDAEASFQEIDTNGGGIILFNEFSEWAIAKGLDLEEEHSDDDDADAPAPKAAAVPAAKSSVATKKPSPTVKTTGGAPKPAAKKSGGSFVKKTSSASPIKPAAAAPPPAKKKSAEEKGAFLTEADAKKNLDEYDEVLSVPGVTTVNELFRSLDMNGNGMLSLAELDKAIVQIWPKFNSKPAIMRAYKAADKNGTGFVSKKEFEYFLDYIVVYHNTWVNFTKIDTSGDRRLTEEEFVQGAVQLGIQGETEESLKQMFDDMDKNDGGIVLFDEFCAAFAQKNTSLRSPTPPAKNVGGAKTARGRKDLSGTNQSGMSGASSARTKPVVDSPLAAPRKKPVPPPPATPAELKIPGPPRKKIRLVGDPSVEALEAKVRERRAADRLRQEQLHAKAVAMQEEFEKRERERQEERARLLEAERRAKEEEYERRRQEREEAERARQQRLQGVLKIDPDIIAGKKSIAERLAERAAELKRQEDEELEQARQHRRQVCAMGPNFYSDLKQHEDRIKARLEMEAKERQNRRVQVTAVAPLPAEYQTRVRQKILESDEQKRIETIHYAQIAMEKRKQTMAYADGAQKEHRPVSTKPFIPPETKKGHPREVRETRGDGNAAIRGNKGYTSPQPASTK